MYGLTEDLSSGLALLQSLLVTLVEAGRRLSQQVILTLQLCNLVLGVGGGVGRGRGWSGVGRDEMTVYTCTCTCLVLMGKE